MLAAAPLVGPPHWSWSRGVWLDMGVGVGGVCGPKVAPLASLPVWEVEQPPPPPGVCLWRWVWGAPPRAPNYARDTPKVGDVVHRLRYKLRQGFLPREEIVRVGRYTW